MKGGNDSLTVRGRHHEAVLVHPADGSSSVRFDTKGRIFSPRLIIDIVLQLGIIDSTELFAG